MILTQYPAETPRRDAGAGGWQGGSMTRTAPVFTLTPGLPVVQIGHMGPAAYPLGQVIGLVALGRALRRAGAAADVGAAVEAALGRDLLYPPA